MTEEKRGADDLFGDEELGPPMPAARRPEKKRGGGGVWLVLLVIICLLAGGFWYLADANHQQFFLRVEAGKVKVERGIFFPVGTSLWVPNRAYETFELPQGYRVSAAGPITAVELDRELLRIYQEIASREIRDLRKGKADVAEEMLLRAGKLNATTAADDRKILEMLGDVAFRRGLGEIQGIQARFDEALRQFKLAAMRGGREYKGAADWVESIERLKSEFRALSVESGLDPDAIMSGISPTPTLDEVAPVDRSGKAAAPGADGGPDATPGDAGPPVQDARALPPPADAGPPPALDAGPPE